MRLHVTLLMALVGCIEWTAPQMQQQRLLLSSPVVELRRDQLPGSGGLLADGSFRFQIDLAHVCRKTEIVKGIYRRGEAALAAG